MKAGRIVAVVDIGSTKVCCCIANVSEDNHFDILGVGYCVCFGIKHGMIIDMDFVSTLASWIVLCDHRGPKQSGGPQLSYFHKIVGAYR